jgi:hypothetical protein
MSNTVTHYKSYIADGPHSSAFDSATGRTPDSARAAVKRRNSPDWRDCVVWVVEVYGDGQERMIG